jgi:hypothetical protein
MEYRDPECLTPAPSGRELYRLLFSLQPASPEAFGYTLVPLEQMIIL